MNTSLTGFLQYFIEASNLPKKFIDQKFPKNPYESQIYQHAPNIPWYIFLKGNWYKINVTFEKVV